MIELLVVIAIIAILSIVVILTLNPAALMQQSRDATRVSDMSTLNSAISVYLSVGGLSLGNTNTVYVSIPDPTATSTVGDQCQGLGLPTLPSTYTYHCAATSTVRSTDSTGWIPINFGTVAIGSSLSQLPIDPINQSSSRLYYTYTTNGTQFEVTSAMESAKYQIGGSNDIISGDGGTLASVYEKGSKLGLEPLDYGDPTLVGYWPLTEGTGTVAYDDSGNNASGTWYGTQAGTSGYYSLGKGGGYQWAGQFDGSSTFALISNILAQNNLVDMTLSAWIKMGASCPSNCRVLSQQGSSYWLLDVYNNMLTAYFSLDGISGSSEGYALNNHSWHYIALARNTESGSIAFWLDGQLVGSVATNGKHSPYPITANVYISSYGGGSQFFPGLINGVRIYNRALSASQIAAMYAGGK